MEYRLGLDLGTNSIGWAVVDITQIDTPTLVDAGVRIFSDGRMPARGGPVGEPLAVQRRNARAMRRQRDRRKRRQRLVLHELQRTGFVPPTKEERHSWLHASATNTPGAHISSRGLAQRVFSRVLSYLGKQAAGPAKDTEVVPAHNPYFLRAKALDHTLEPYELGRVIMHLSLHRGFQSNRKTDSGDPESSKQYEKIGNLKAQIATLGYRTLGEYLWERHKAGEPVRFRPGQIDLYPDRALYKDEFSAIRARQEPHHPSLNWDRIEELVYYQRDLQTQERGRCRYYTDDDRGFSDMPSITWFRIFQEVRNLRYTDSHGQILPLSPSHEDELLASLNKHKTLSFDSIRKIAGTTATFNLESDKRTKLIGNEIGVTLRKIVGERWDELSLIQQDAIVDALYTAETIEVVESHVRSILIDVTSEQLSALSNAPVRRRTAAVSPRFARDCVELMDRKRMTYVKATEQLGFDHVEHGMEGEYDQLPYYGEVLPNSTVQRHPETAVVSGDPTSEEAHWGKLTNVSVHITLNQLRKVVNALIKRYGKPTQIAVELGRDLKYPKSRVEEIVKEQAHNQKDNERVDRDLKELGILDPSADDRLKYKLWEELGHDSTARTCVYCGRTIGCRELFYGDIEIEHILPKSRTLLNGRSNLTVAHRSCNHVKGNRTPFEAFHTNPQNYRYDEILARANRAFHGKKKENFSKAAMQDIPEVGAFLERQATDNAYIARIAVQYLTAICHKNNVWASNGKLTWIARKRWGLDTLLTHPAVNTAAAVKNRADHRHHALDAITIAFTTRSIIQQTARLSAQDTRGRYWRGYKLPDCPVPGMHQEQFRQEVMKVLQRILPSVRQDHSWKGKLFEETALGEHAFPQRKTNENGKLWGYRKAITSLNLKEVQNSIVDLQLSAAINAYVDARSGKKLEAILTQFSEDTGIRRVRIVAKNQKPRPMPAARNRAYADADILCCVVWSYTDANGKKRFKPVYWSRRDVTIDTSSLADRRPHPTARKLHTFYKNDVIAFTDGKSTSYARVAGLPTDNRLDLQPLHAASPVLEWSHETNPDLQQWTLKKTGGNQNFHSINPLYNKYRVRKVIITPDGQIKCRQYKGDPRSN